MMRPWIRHFAWAAIVTYLVMLVIAFSQPQYTWLVLGDFGLGRIGRIVCVVIGVSWASAYTFWIYARRNEIR